MEVVIGRQQLLSKLRLEILAATLLQEQRNTLAAELAVATHALIFVVELKHYGLCCLHAGSADRYGKIQWAPPSNQRSIHEPVRVSK